MNTVRLVLASIAMSLLSACSYATEAQVVECEQREGEVVSDYFIYKQAGEGFFESEIESGALEYCRTKSGAIGEVYNEEMTTPTTGFFADADNNDVLKVCTSRSGRVYETTTYTNDQTHYYWLCVQDGRVLDILSY